MSGTILTFFGTTAVMASTPGWERLAAFALTFIWKKMYECPLKMKYSGDQRCGVSAGNGSLKTEVQCLVPEPSSRLR